MVTPPADLPSDPVTVSDAQHPGRSVLQLAVALSDNPRTRPLIEGRVPVEGVRLIPTVCHPSEMFWRQLRYGDFHVSEMSLSTLSIATAQGKRDWVGIPVYTMRKFFHTAIVVRRDAGIKTPADLKGKRVGVPEYQQTAAIWVRGVLQHEFGVKPQDMKWFMERGADKSHGVSTGFRAPAGVTIAPIPPTTNIGEMLVKGELDACVHYIADANLVDRSRVDIGKEPSIAYLFDAEAEAKRYYEKSGIFPINHIVVVKRALYERHPWIALNLYSAFVKAKEEVRKAAQPWIGINAEVGALDGKARQALAKDVMPYGLNAARHVLETVTQYVHEQSLCDRRVALEEIFAPNTLDL
jgi:4,5-dihydroxyphthalate decarboxylase